MCQPLELDHLPPLLKPAKWGAFWQQKWWGRRAGCCLALLLPEVALCLMGGPTVSNNTQGGCKAGPVRAVTWGESQGPYR